MTMRLISPCLTAALMSLTLNSPVWAQKPGIGSGGCFVAHFKSLVLKTHNPEQRAGQAEDWLKRYAGSCSREQLTAIRANSPNWLGTALTLEVSSIIDATMEAKDAGNPAMLAQMYESAGQEFKSGTVLHANPLAPAPLVPAQGNIMPMAGAVNYGNTNNQPVNAAPVQPAPAGPLPLKTK